VSLGRTTGNTRRAESSGGDNATESRTGGDDASDQPGKDRKAAKRRGSGSVEP
jgi:hypothetical protein